jgi:hypothetical protein
MEIIQLDTHGQTPIDDAFPLGTIIGIENTGEGFGVIHHQDITQEEVAAILYGVAQQIINSTRTTKDILQ